MTTQVALKRFIDDVAVEVIETELVSRLTGLISPVQVFQMTPEFVTRIAGESEESKANRRQLQNQFDVLAKGYETCKRFFTVGQARALLTDDDADADRDEPDEALTERVRDLDIGKAPTTAQEINARDPATAAPNLAPHTSVKGARAEELMMNSTAELELEEETEKVDAEDNGWGVGFRAGKKPKIQMKMTKPTWSVQEPAAAPEY
jgi:hypothetical protein